MIQFNQLFKRSTKRLTSILFGLLLILTLCAVLHIEFNRVPVPQFEQPEYTNAKLDNVQRHLNEILQEFKPFQRCNDSLLAADPMRSKIKLNGGHVVNLSDTVCLRVILYDGYGRPKTAGGDHLRARLYNESVGAFVPGQVLDHRNGTYSVTFKALWVGWAAVDVEVLFPRELIAAGLRIRTAWNFRNIKANFNYKNISGESPCHPDAQVFEKLYNKRPACNFSYWNKALPWFCGIPPHVQHLTCKHWASISRTWESYAKDISNCENELSNRAFDDVPNKVLINIQPTLSAKSQVTVEQPQVACTDYNTTRLWFKSEPTGYFYKEKWILRHCNGLMVTDMKCLNNATIFFMGDSTLLQWINGLLSKFSFTCTILRDDTHTWRQTKTCFCNKYNITLNWLPHNIPVSPFSGKHLFHFFSNTFTDAIRNVKKSDKIIFILHLYAHLQMYPLTFFAAHIVEMRNLIETILEKVHNVRMFLKLPHAFRERRHDQWKLKQPDYIGFIYTDIIRNVFKGLYQKIIVLDNLDATIALRELRLHPPSKVVNAMINQLLSYICDKQK